MSASLIDAFDTAWTASAPALQVTVDSDGNRLEAPNGAAGASASFTPPAPLDLTPFDELRFWIRASRLADGW